MFKENINNGSREELLSCCFCDHVSPNINNMSQWLLLCYLRVRFQLASPPGFRFITHPEGELCIMYKCVFLPSGIFSLPAAGLFSCSRLRGTQGARPDQRVSLSPGRGLRHVLWRFKVASPLGEGFRARRACLLYTSDAADE